MADIELQSFGFKYGLPRANNIIDVSFLKNPARTFGLGSKTGQQHVDFVLQQESTAGLLRIATELAVFLIKQHDTPILAFGCSAGRHRSVCIADEVAKRLREIGYTVRVVHTTLERFA